MSRCGFTLNRRLSEARGNKTLHDSFMCSCRRDFVAKFKSTEGGTWQRRDTACEWTGDAMTQTIGMEQRSRLEFHFDAQQVRLCLRRLLTAQRRRRNFFGDGGKSRRRRRLNLIELGIKRFFFFSCISKFVVQLNNFVGNGVGAVVASRRE